MCGCVCVSVDLFGVHFLPTEKPAISDWHWNVLCVCVHVLHAVAIKMIVIIKTMIKETEKALTYSVQFLQVYFTLFFFGYIRCIHQKHFFSLCNEHQCLGHDTNFHFLSSEHKVRRCNYWTHTHDVARHTIRMRSVCFIPTN